MEDGITIQTERGNRISVDYWEDWGANAPSEVWLSIAVPMASVSAVLTKAQAKELAQFLIKFSEVA